MLLRRSRAAARGGERRRAGRPPATTAALPSPTTCHDAAPFALPGRRSRDPSRDRRNAARSCRPTTSTGSPSLTLRARAEPADEERVRGSEPPSRSRADVARELLRLLGLGRPRALDGEVHHQLRAERLAELDRARAAAGRAACRARARRPRGARAGCPRITVRPSYDCERRAACDARLVELELLARRARRARLPFSRLDRSPRPCSSPASR